MKTQQLELGLAQPSSKPKSQRANLKVNKPTNPGDTQRCAACGERRSVFTLHKHKLYCPGTEWGKPSCVPTGG